MRALALTLLLAGCAPKATAAKKSACVDCHATETAEWNASLHKVAFSDRDFQASFAIEPAQFCADCHQAAAAGCSTCHGSGHGQKTSDCSGCHEFEFPHRTPQMQSTLREHAASPFADVACSSCHMARAKDGHRDHRFDVTRNAAVLRAAIDVSSTRTATGVAVELRARNVGHKFPTGDLFRRIRVFVRTDLDEEEAVIGRRFDQTMGPSREVADTRIDQTRTVNFDGAWLVAAPRVSVEVRYERVAETQEIPNARGSTSRRDSIFASVVLAEQEVR